MAFCVNCGNQVANDDRFCGRCGSAQQAQQQPPKADAAGSSSYQAGDFPSNIDSRTAALLCYIPLVGWLASIVVLASNRFRNDTTVRFHAFQGLYLFVAWLVIEWVVGPLGRIPGIYIGLSISKLLKVVILGAWVWMLLKVAQKEDFKLPLVGEWAEKSVAEQRF